jgi:hypothetical protein
MAFGIAARAVLLAALVSVFAVGSDVVAEPRTAAQPTIKVSADGRDLEIKRASDAQPVRVPVLDRCGNPAVGTPRIRDVRRSKETVIATYGKHCFARVSLKTLTVECAGCD